MGGKQSRNIERNIRAELEHQLSLIRNEVLSTKSNLEASKNEVQSLKQQLSTYQNTQQRMDMQLHKANSEVLSINVRFVHELSSIRNEMTSTKDSLGASKIEVENLKQQLPTCQNTLQRIMDMQSHKATELENHLHSTNSEVVSTNARLIALQEEVNKLKQQMLSKENIEQDIGRNLHRMIELENQVHSSNVELLSRKSSLELSNIDVNALSDQIMFCDKSNQDMKIKWDKVMEIETRLFSSEVELVRSKSRLEAIKEEENGLVEELLARDCFEQDMEVKLHNVLELEKQLHLVESQTTLDKDCFESLDNKERVLRKELSSCEKFDKDMEMKVERILRLEKQISCAISEAIFAKVNIESLEKQEEVLKEELFAQEKFQQDVEMDLKKKIIELDNYLSCSNVEALSKVDSKTSNK